MSFTSTKHTLNVDDFRCALSQFATGVTIITTRIENDVYFGMTANSFNSVSMQPPLVLWSLNTAAQIVPVFQKNTHYVVNILQGNQAHLAKQFASKMENRFEGVAYTLSPQGYPIITGAAAWLECKNRSQYPEGDHIIFVGEVEQIGVSPTSQDHPALVYHQRQFKQA